MTWYYYIAWIAAISQSLFVYQMLRNYRYAMKKHKKNRQAYQPRCVLIVPCKGRDLNFEKNIASFFNLAHKNYLLWFVVEDQSDPAYGELCRLKDKLSQSSTALDIRILVAGKAAVRNNSQENAEVKTYSRSQKIHNLLYCCDRIPEDVEMIAFADSDICVLPNWLNHLTFPLRKSRYGASTGYRWFVPQKNNIATLALSCINAKIAQLLGDSIFNQAWGGSMAIRIDTFRELGLDKIWANALSDDLSLGRAVKKANKKIIFAPACLVASHEHTTFKKLFEFGRRQFLITRISSPGTWWFGLFSSIYSVAGLWGTAGMALYAAAINDANFNFFAAVAVLFFVSHLTRAVLRQNLAAHILKNERHKMKAAMVADILFFWVWSFLLLILITSSAFGRTITWRGIRYKILGPEQILMIEH